MYSLQVPPGEYSVVSVAMVTPPLHAASKQVTGSQGLMTYLSFLRSALFILVSLICINNFAVEFNLHSR